MFTPLDLFVCLQNTHTNTSIVISKCISYNTVAQSAKNANNVVSHYLACCPYSMMLSYKQIVTDGSLI